MISNNQQGTSKPYTLTIGGRDYLAPGDGKPYIPVNEFPITWDDTIGNSSGYMSVTVYDPEPLWANRAPIKTGQEVLFKRATGETIFGGVVTSITWRKAVAGRYAELSVADFNAWLDWRIVPRLHNKVNTTSDKVVRYTANDDTLIKSRIFGTDKRHGPLTTMGGHVERTSTSMTAGFSVEGATLRTALEAVAEEANNDGVPRLFYIDHQKRLHYYKRRESSNGAPFRITDAEYGALVAGVPAVAYWPLGEAPNADATDRMGAVDLTTHAGTATVGSRLVPNQPAYSWANDGSTFTLSGDGTALVTSGGWAFEVWYKVGSLASAKTLLDTSGGTDNGPTVSVNTGGDVVITNNGDASARTYDTNLAVGSRYHLLVGITSAGTPFCYKNGSAATGSGTVNATGDGFTVISLAPDFNGEVSQAAWYEGTLPDATAAYNHFNAGRAIIPEDMVWTDDSETETHHVYVRGKNAKGSGWVGPYGGTFTHAKQAYITREKSDTAAKRNKAGRNFLRRQENHYTGSFSITDPDHSIGWRAGQTLYVDDDGIAFTSSDTHFDGTSRQPFEVVNVSGSMSGGNEVRLDIEYGVLRRTILRAIAKR